jgi:hypothetical protein
MAPGLPRRDALRNVKVVGWFDPDHPRQGNKRAEHMASNSIITLVKHRTRIDNVEL